MRHAYQLARRETAQRRDASRVVTAADLFELPEADMGCHPAGPEEGAASGTHAISFYCDDIHSTVSELRSRGVGFTQEIADHGYGYVTYFSMPGGVRVQLYEPKYRKRAAAPKRRTAPARRVSGTAKKRVARPARTTRRKTR